MSSWETRKGRDRWAAVALEVETELKLQMKATHPGPVAFTAETWASSSLAWYFYGPGNGLRGKYVPKDVLVRAEEGLGCPQAM